MRSRKGDSLARNLGLGSETGNLDDLPPIDSTLGLLNDNALSERAYREAKKTHKKSPNGDTANSPTNRPESGVFKTPASEILHSDASAPITDITAQSVEAIQKAVSLANAEETQDITPEAPMKPWSSFDIMNRGRAARRSAIFAKLNVPKNENGGVYEGKLNAERRKDEPTEYDMSGFESFPRPNWNELLGIQVPDFLLSEFNTCYKTAYMYEVMNAKKVLSPEALGKYAVFKYLMNNFHLFVSNEGRRQLSTKEVPIPNLSEKFKSVDAALANHGMSLQETRDSDGYSTNERFSLAYLALRKTYSRQELDLS